MHGHAVRTLYSATPCPDARRSFVRCSAYCCTGLLTASRSIAKAFANFNLKDMTQGQTNAMHFHCLHKLRQVRCEPVSGGWRHLAAALGAEQRQRRRGRVEAQVRQRAAGAQRVHRRVLHQQQRARQRRRAVARGPCGSSVRGSEHVRDQLLLPLPGLPGVAAACRSARHKSARQPEAGPAPHTEVQPSLLSKVHLQLVTCSYGVSRSEKSNMSTLGWPAAMLGRAAAQARPGALARTRPSGQIPFLSEISGCIGLSRGLCAATRESANTGMRSGEERPASLSAISTQQIVSDTCNNCPGSSKELALLTCGAKLDLNPPTFKSDGFAQQQLRSLLQALQ